MEALSNRSTMKDKNGNMLELLTVYWSCTLYFYSQGYGTREATLNNGGWRIREGKNLIQLYWTGGILLFILHALRSG